MRAHPTAYLVLASQRCGSTLLVESLRATGSAGEPQEFFQYLPTTGMAPQPREWFAGADDESILRLLDPLEPGTPDTATPVAWREHIRSSGRTPNGIWGGKLMWNQTPLLRQRASQLPDRSGEALKAAVRDVIGSEPVYVHVYRPDVVSQAVSFWRAAQTRVWRGRPDPARGPRAHYSAGAAYRLDEADMGAHAAAARRRLGQLTGGAEGRALVDRADAALAARQIV